MKKKEKWGRVVLKRLGERERESFVDNDRIYTYTHIYIYIYSHTFGVWQGWAKIIFVPSPFLGGKPQINGNESSRKKKNSSLKRK